MAMPGRCSGPNLQRRFHAVTDGVSYDTRLLAGGTGGTEPGSIPAELGSDIHAVVHQAAGMVSVQLNVSMANALVRLRAHAFATDRPLNEVAGQVIARTLRLDHLDPP